MGKINLYTIVTNDEYEFPVQCDLKVKEAADFLGITTNNVYQRVFKPVKKSKYKIVITGRVKFDKQIYDKMYSLSHDRSQYFKKYYRKKVKLDRKGVML